MTESQSRGDSVGKQKDTRRSSLWAVDRWREISVYEKIRELRLISRDQGRIISETMILKEGEIGIMMTPNVWPVYIVNIVSLLKFIDNENSRNRKSRS